MPSACAGGVDTSSPDRSLTWLDNMPWLQLQGSVFLRTILLRTRFGEEYSFIFVMPVTQEEWSPSRDIGFMGRGGGLFIATTLGNATHTQWWY